MGTRDEAVARAMAVLKALLTTGIVAAGAALFPFLNLPVVRQVFEYMVGKIAEYMVTKGEFKAFSYMIDERVSAQTKDFFDAALGLSEAQKKGDKDAIRLAENNLIKSADRFLSLVS
jgi:hypothetical protein